MRRLGVSLLLVVVAAVIGVGWAVDGLFGRLERGESESLRTARALAGALARSIEASPAGAAPFAADGIVRTMPRAALPLPAELDAALDAGEPLVLESGHGVTLYIALPSTGRVLATDVPGTNRSGTGLRLSLTLAFYGAVIALILVWLFPLVRRLQRLADGARAFGAGDLTRRLVTDRRSRLHDIESEFNRMAGRIEGLMADNRLLGNAVSHDLRTPLARLRFGVDALGESDDERVRRRYLSRISADLDDMERLVEVLLEFGRLERQLHELPLGTIDLGTPISRAVDAAGVDDARPIDWHAPNEAMPVEADERYAGMLVTNLLQNALEHGRYTVRVSVLADGERTVLDVEDDGPGIATEERGRVLAPFVRGARADRDGDAGERTDDPGKHGRRRGRGHGLGLAIVARIADWHGATLSIGRSEALGGASVRVAFRRAAARTSAVRAPARRDGAT